ncbi:MAG: uracil-DNA glycosylase [Chloroflexota bacterium]
MVDLAALDQRVRACTVCALAATRTNAVPGEGSPTARVLFVGEGPGYNEDRQGRPFVGAAGSFLNQMLGSIGLAREDVYIANMVKCRPPQNRDPFPNELAACAHFLDEQIALIAPQVIVPLGRHALSRWFPDGSISRLRAKAQRVDGQLIFPLYHPAAALHNGSLRATIEADFRALGDLLAILEAPAPPTTHHSPTEPPAHRPDNGEPPDAGSQLPMF